MTDSAHQTPAGDDASTTTGQIRSEIEQTRVELSQTVDKLADKLSVKNQTQRSARVVKDRVTSKASQVKASAPEPVQRGLDATGAKLSPLAHELNAVTRPHRQKIFLSAVGAAVVLLIVRKVRAGDDDT